MNPELLTPLTHTQPNSAPALAEALTIWDATPNRAKEDPSDGWQGTAFNLTLPVLPWALSLFTEL